MKYLYLSILILILGYFQFLNPFRNAIQYIFTPIQFGFRELAVDISETGSFFKGIQTIRSENIRLLEENNLLRSSLVDLKLLKDENELLKKQLSLKESISDELVLAEILKDSTDLTGSRFYINKGSSDGISVGDNVIYENYLVGLIRKVDRFRSLGELITSSEVSVAVYDVDSANKTEGLASGQYSSTIKVSRILPTEEIEIGDFMVTSGKDGIFNPGLLVGKVNDIEETPAETLKSAYLETFVDLSKLKKVFILKNQ